MDPFSVLASGLSLYSFFEGLANKSEREKRERKLAGELNRQMMETYGQTLADIQESLGNKIAMYEGQAENKLADVTGRTSTNVFEALHDVRTAAGKTGMAGSSSGALEMMKQRALKSIDTEYKGARYGVMDTLGTQMMSSFEKAGEQVGDIEKWMGSMRAQVVALGQEPAGEYQMMHPLAEEAYQSWLKEHGQPPGPPGHSGRTKYMEQMKEYMLQYIKDQGYSISNLDPETFTINVKDRYFIESEKEAKKLWVEQYGTERGFEAYYSQFGGVWNMPEEGWGLEPVEQLYKTKPKPDPKPPRWEPDPDPWDPTPKPIPDPPVPPGPEPEPTPGPPDPNPPPPPPPPPDDEDKKDIPVPPDPGDLTGGGDEDEDIISPRPPRKPDRDGYDELPDIPDLIPEPDDTGGFTPIKKPIRDITDLRDLARNLPDPELLDNLDVSPNTETTKKRGEIGETNRIFGSPFDDRHQTTTRPKDDDRKYGKYNRIRGISRY